MTAVLLVLEVILFNGFIDSMDCGIECNVRKFEGNAKPSGAVDKLEGRFYKGWY